MKPELYTLIHSRCLISQQALEQKTTTQNRIQKPKTEPLYFIVFQSPTVVLFRPPTLCHPKKRCTRGVAKPRPSPCILAALLQEFRHRSYTYMCTLYIGTHICTHHLLGLCIYIYIYISIYIYMCTHIHICIHILAAAAAKH